MVLDLKWLTWEEGPREEEVPAGGAGPAVAEGA